MSDLTSLTAAELATGYRSKQFSPTEVTDALLARIAERNTSLNAYLEVFDDVRDAAARATEAFASSAQPTGALAGVPIAVKDNILIKGKRVSAGSKMLQEYTATYDATAITKLRSEGALFIGRTNMDEFAMGSSTEHSAYGPTRNPVDETRVPGGSSGGSAAAVAAHLAPVALGSETCGSIRQPSSLCGLVGLKPTYGAVSRSGLIAMGSSLDQIGPFARSVDDAELLFNVMKGQDPLDGTTLPTYTPTTGGKTIGVPWDFVNDAHPDTRAVFEARIAELKSKGYVIKDISLPSAPHALPVYYIIMPAEVSTNLARLDGVRYGLHVDGTSLLDDYKLSRREGFGPETRRRIMLGSYILSAGYYDAYYRRATALRSQIAAELDSVFTSVDAIATPTAPGPAFKIGEKSDPVSMYLEDIFSAPANLAGLPSISVPMGTVTRDGVALPVGIQFMSPKQTEGTLFAIARDTMGA